MGAPDFAGAAEADQVLDDVAVEGEPFHVGIAPTIRRSGISLSTGWR
jgi:hypothetical protein